MTSDRQFCIIKSDKKMAKRLFLITHLLEYMNKLTNYIIESIAEMKKVTWPTKKETYNYTILVIGISIGIALFLGLLDYIFTEGFQIIFK